ncbi:MAG: uridine kinase [Cyanobacteria bacterium SBC]|nr:uridine kinase [Cyanobacteria bacterium SBC]
MLNLQNILDSILEIRDRIPKQRSMLLTVSGIDGCGKGYLTLRIVDGLKAFGVNAVGIGGDGWLNLPDRRFNSENPAEHFYLYAFRFDEMFSRFVLPLRDRRSISIEANFTEETATTYRKQLYEFEEVEVIVLEAIYLLQPAFVDEYDFSLWIDCSFKTALERALARGQEGLPTQEVINAYRTIYFPAQVIHFQRDNPRALATATINNDPRSIESQGYPSLLELQDFES